MADKKVVIAGSKNDGPDFIRLKLHEEYGRVWLYTADDEGRSNQRGRILCIDDDGRLRIHAKHKFMVQWNKPAVIMIEWPE